MDAPVTDELYQVVRNDEEQYSIWRTGSAPPEGWHAVGFEGDRDACLAHIEEVWTDLRPLSLRQALAEPRTKPPVPPGPTGPTLVSRLCASEQPVKVVLRPEPSLERLRSALSREYVQLLFSSTDGGTEVGIRLSAPGAIDLSAADMTAGTGTAQLIGNLVLDFEPLRCIARIDVTTLTGQARLERL
jgi:uncharacterized protein YbdZ (MbtH family)